MADLAATLAKSKGNGHIRYSSNPTSDGRSARHIAVMFPGGYIAEDPLARGEECRAGNRQVGVMNSMPIRPVFSGSLDRPVDCGLQRRRRQRVRG